MKFWQFLKQRQFVFSIVAVAMLFFALQYPVWGQFSDPDGFYHAKASQLLSHGQLPDKFPWMEYTTWKDNYADQHYLYHWLLVPFNNVEHLQLSIVFFAVVFSILFWLFLSVLKVRYKPVWLGLMLLTSVDFLFRINLIKANSLSLALLCAIGIGVYWYHKKAKAWWVLGFISLVSGIFVWTYGGFVCVPLFIGAYCAAVLITKRKLVVAPLIASLIGIAVGLLLHPHHAHFISLMYDQLFQTGLGSSREVPVGNEWLPFNLDWFVRSNAILLLFWFVAITLEIDNALKKKIQTLPLWLHIVAIGFVILTLWHRRFVEYWAPFAALASAITLYHYIYDIKWQEFKDAIQNFWQIRVLLVLLGFFIVLGVGWNLKQVYGSLQGGDQSDKYKEAALWLEQNSEPGDLVLNTQWDEFPQLFYWNSKNYYMVGLDPTFMYLYNQDLYWKWRKVADDKPDDWVSIIDLHELIANELKAKYIFIDANRNEDLPKYIEDNDPGGLYFELHKEFYPMEVVKIK